MLKLIRRRNANAHEGPVYARDQQRLYFASKPNTPSTSAFVQILFWDLETDHVGVWKSDGRMANDMIISCDNSCLLVCEQGDLTRPAGIARYSLANHQRESLVSDFEGKPFNSPNKVVQLANGRIIFSDPDYGRRQLFRPTELTEEAIEDTSFISPEAFAKTGKPKQYLKPSLYTFYAGQTHRISCELQQPHGLAVSPDQRTLYVSDTSADDGVGGFDESRQRDIYKFQLNPESGKLTSKTHVTRIAKGIPDGMTCDKNQNLYCAAGDGIHVYDNSGKEIYHLKLEEGSVNLCLAENQNWLFVTTDKEILLYEVK